MKPALLIILTCLLSLGAIAAQQDAHIMMYPNPAHEHIYIRTDIQGAYRIEIINLIGEVVISEDIANNTVSISDLSSGIYVVRIYGTDGQLYLSSKLTKQ